MRPAPYQLTMPERRLTGVVFASPHSGRDYPAGFLRASVLDAVSYTHLTLPTIYPV